MKIYDNPNAVLTNAPELSSHLENLRNYVNLSPAEAKEGEINGITLARKWALAVICWNSR